MEQNVETKSNRKPGMRMIFIIIGILAGIFVIAMAAFLGGQLLNRKASGMSLMPIGNSPGSVSSGVINIESAQEIPTTEPEVVGIFSERKDNTIFVQEIPMSPEGGGVIVAGGDGGASTGPAFSTGGPIVEVVVTSDTLIYVDVTQIDFQSGNTEGIQQEIEGGSLDDVNNQTMMTVWGRKVGDRVIADVILYSNPVIFTTP